MPLRVAPIDGLLILLTLIWGSNFSVVKTALEEIPPLPFNALRMSLATALFLALVAKTAPDSLPARRAWPGLVGLGLVGHFLYQVCFMEGIARTSVANSSLILGATPVVVALLNVVSRRDVPSGWHWLGIGLSLLGVYLVVGQGARVGTTSLTGDLLMMGAACCWAAYTVGARSMLDRHSALVVTAWTMAVGTALFVPLGLPGLVALEWRVVSLGALVRARLLGGLRPVCRLRHLVHGSSAHRQWPHIGLRQHGAGGRDGGGGRVAAGAGGSGPARRRRQHLGRVALTKLAAPRRTSGVGVRVDPNRPGTSPSSPRRGTFTTGC